MQITLITVGKLKEKYFVEASKEYEKRLSTYCKLEVKEIDQARLPQNPSGSEIDIALKEETVKIKKAIPQNSEIITLCIEGEMMDSVKLSKKLENLRVSGCGKICFIIGGSYGIDEEIKAMSKLRLSMSKMTFPHRLARIMLLEQIYRAYKITEGGTYHK